MPIFEYECDDCGKRSEKLVLNGNHELKECPACGGRVTKLISAPLIQFKGSGWYITDYQNKDKEKKSLRSGINKESTSKPQDDMKGSESKVENSVSRKEVHSGKAK